jgi:hypothetical protein
VVDQEVALRLNLQRIHSQVEGDEQVVFHDGQGSAQVVRRQGLA